MSRVGRNVNCEHARIWAALAPDGELSELEQRSLRSHLRTCSSCAGFAREAEAVARLLRSQKLVRPSSIPVVPRAPRRRAALVARARPIAAAAAVAVMALGVASRAPLPVDERDSSLRATTAAVTRDRAEMTSLRVRRSAVFAVTQAELAPLPSLTENEPA